MIRVETETGWLLIAHQDHARLAGAFGQLWGNKQFVPPQPLDDILVAVSRHDDAWTARDAAPLITPDGKPSAFSKELVGTYAAFENIDLEDYLAVRGAATEAVADDNPFAAVLVSMHTVNLLTEQADLSGLSEEERRVHSGFIQRQRSRQKELMELLPAGRTPDKETLRHAFEFLQACDSLSLIVCVKYSDSIALRHSLPTTNGKYVTINCYPEGGHNYRLDPWPLKVQSCELSIPAVKIEGKSFASDDELRNAFREGRQEKITITVHQ